MEETAGVYAGAMPDDDYFNGGLFPLLLCLLRSLSVLRSSACSFYFVGRDGIGTT
jgi:hypothetical protein